MNNAIAKEIQKLYADKDIAQILDMISINVWDRIAFSRGRKGFKIYETTITQDMLHHMALAADVSDHGMKLFEAKSEKANGNDIECYIKTHGGFLFFPIQAKLLYADHSYTQISHNRNNIDQIDLLVDYAKKKKGYPLYFLYNSLPESRKINELLEYPKSYGISFASAIYIKEQFQKRLKNKSGERKWHIPSFYDLHPEFAKPLKQFCRSYQNTLLISEIIDMFFQFPLVDYDLTTFSKEELLHDDSWTDLTPNNHLEIEDSLTKMEEATLMPVEKHGYTETSKVEDSQNRFNPKFRLILSNKDMPY